MAESSLTIHLSFVDADPGRPDPAANGVVARGAAGALRQQGYIVQPVSTGERGGYEFEVLKEVWSTLNDNRELITSFVDLLTPIVTYVLGREQNRTQQDNDAKQTTIVVHIGSASKEIPIHEQLDDKALLAELLELEDVVQTVDVVQQPPRVEVRVASPSPRRRR